MIRIILIMTILITVTPVTYAYYGQTQTGFEAHRTTALRLKLSEHNGLTGYCYVVGGLKHMSYLILVLYKNRRVIGENYIGHFSYRDFMEKKKDFSRHVNLVQKSLSEDGHVTLVKYRGVTFAVGYYSVSNEDKPDSFMECSFMPYNYLDDLTPMHKCTIELLDYKNLMKAAEEQKKRMGLYREDGL